MEFICGFLCCASLMIATTVRAHETTSFKFDFGGAETKTGWVHVSPMNFYSTAAGFGFEPDAEVAVGLLPAALATGVGADSHRPFALVIVSGLFSRLLIGIFLMPALYAPVARSGNRLEV
jgi:hypothetical protein